MRFFCITTDAAYEQARATLDAAWGHPNADTATCVEPAATAPHDADGRVLLAVLSEFCQYAPADQLLPQLVASGVVDEIDAATYESTIARPMA